MRHLTHQDADKYLSQIGMKIGSWNEIAASSGSKGDQRRWINYQAPKNSLELYCFAQHIAGWIPKGNWKILQLDNSTSLNRHEASLLGRLLFGSAEHAPDGPAPGTFLFEFTNDRKADAETELLISNLIFALLLFESHAYVTSSGSSAGQLLGIQDGFAYFYSSERGEDISGAKSVLKIFERAPLATPSWALDGGGG